MQIFVGTSGYAYKEWQGKFYPAKISPKEMLRFYAERLHAVEINNTFYHMPTAPVLISWAEQVSDDFIFAIKAPQIITHLKRLKDVGGEIEYLFRTLPVLGRKLGPVLFQFPPNFRSDRPQLMDFLALIPPHTHCAFEFRHKSWLNDDLFDLLRGRGFSLCQADTDENPAQDIITAAPWGYLRLRRSDYTDADLARWLEIIGSQNWEKAFVFFNHEEKAKGPELALRFRDLAGLR